MEGARSPLAQLAPEFWAPGWNSVQALTRFQEEINGPLRQGTPGVRLIESASDRRRPYFNNFPARFSRRGDARRVIGLYYAFGSEELSMLSPGVAERAPDMHVALHPDDASELGLQPGGFVRVDWDQGKGDWHVRIRPDLPRGVLGIPVGLPGGFPGPLPEWCGTRKA
jgi:NADH-quinone oxidoreductase subunit G